MKKSLLTLISAVAVAGGINAQTTTPTFFSENFIEMGREHNYVSNGWTTYGVDAQVVDVLSSFYPADDPDLNPYMILNYGNISIPMACTNFTPPTEADQWLISPTISVPEDADNAVLNFTVCVYGATAGLGVGDNLFEIYVSETGTEKADFGKPIYEGVARGSATTEMAQKIFCIPVNGFGGKDVHLAFVAKGKDVGLTGFTNIEFGNYYISFDNRTPTIGEIGEKYTPKVNVKMKTPVACSGMNVIAYINDEKVEESYYKKEFGSSSTSPAIQLVQFKDLIDIKDKTAVNYKLEFVPDYEGAVTSVVAGTVGVPEYSYIPNVVIEEATASGCQYCPCGIASLEYYMETYPGTETQGKAIAIGVHGIMNYYDPMNAGVEDYVSKLMALNESKNLPQAMFNRNTTGLMPNQKSELEKQLNEVSYNEAKIVGVEVPALEDDETIHGREITVKFSVKNGYTAQGVDLSAAVVLIENDVKGNTKGYNQENAFYNRNEAFIKSNYGEWLVPYMSKYIMGGEFGLNSIPFSEMTYQHVARGIFPDFYGDKLNTAWVAGEAQTYEWKVKVPNTIMNWDNVEAIVLVMKNSQINGKVVCPIVGSDIMAADKFTTVSGVAEVSADGIDIVRDGQNIVVTAESGSVVTLYNVEGMSVGRYNVTSGQLNIDAAELNGLVIVKVDNANGSIARKLVF